MSNLPIVVRGGKTPVPLSPLQLYMREVAKYPLLSPEEEYELAVKLYEQGDTSAAHRLITSNLRLVVKIANDFRSSQANVLDLVQEGNYGLMQAVKRFNPYKGVKLSSYAAWWIRAYILRHIMDSKSQVRIGTTAAQRKLFFNLKRETEKLLAEHENVDPKLLAASLDVRERDVIDMQQRLGSPDVSIDVAVSDDPKSPTHGELMASDREAIDDMLAKEEVKAIFRGHLKDFTATLAGRDLEVFQSRLMAEEPLTLQQVGDRYGISRQRAQQIENRVLSKLKEFVKSKGKLEVK